MRKHLILVGGGHAHMVTLENIRYFVGRGYKVTVIAPSFHHYYSGMGPGMLGGTYSPGEIRFATKQVVDQQGGIFIKDYVDRIDPDQKLVFTRSGHHFSYDVLSFNAGSQVPAQSLFPQGEMPANVYSVKPIEKLMEARNRLIHLAENRQQIVVSVVGGGPSAAEVAGNIWQLARKLKAKASFIIRIFAGGRFMSTFPQGIRRRVKRILKNRGIEILETGYVESVGPDAVVQSSGAVHPTDFTFMALGVKPSPIFAASGLPMGPDGGLEVNEFLQCVGNPDIFGGGDCIHFEPQPLDKVGVYAVRQNPVLCQNLMAALEGDALTSFDPGNPYLLIFNLGGGRGVLKKHSIMLSGRLAFWIKDFIDTRFMKKFQAIEKSRNQSRFQLRARNH
ncbi:MAG: FAD-dependent oxidoreductase [Desulfobacterales bacterium]|nr:FAD-dependent oxidoreductase [Desulfobacterales bacterium]